MKKQYSKFIIKRFYNLIKAFPILTIHDFYLSLEENNIIKSPKKLRSGQTILPNIANRILFKSIKKKSEGWYFLGIKHKGDNYCYGKIIIGQSSFIQGRPIFPGKRRWRIIHINNKNTINITLENVNKKLVLDEIWLIKIPFIEAWRRIRKRCKDFHHFKNSYFPNIKEFKKIWKIYNKELLSQSNNIAYESFNYKIWQNLIEDNTINKILKKNKKNKKFKYLIQDPSTPEIVEDDAFVILLKKGDSLSQNIFEILDYYLTLEPETKLISADEDCIDIHGKRFNPHFKSAWNRELFWHKQDYNNCWVIKSNYWNFAINYLLKKYNCLSFFSIITFITFSLEKNKKIDLIKHLPFVLYHNLQNDLKKNKSIIEKDQKFLFKFISNNSSILGNCTKINISELTKEYKIHWALPKKSLLSIIIPIRDKIEYLDACLQSIYKNDPGIPYEIFIVDNDSKEIKTKKYLREFFVNKSYNFKRKVYGYPGDFNFSDMNNIVAKKVNGNVILFLNNDIEFIRPEWGYELASNALRPGIGFVGGKLLYADETVQHAGVILGIGGVAGHAFKYLKKFKKGYFSRLSLAQELSALTGACLAISKENWNKLKGFENFHLPINYNDIDICLEARVLGLRNIFLPNVEAYHHESKTRGRPKGKGLKNWEKEKNFMIKKWGFLINKDPCYSPYLTLFREDFSKTMKLPKQIELRSSSIDKF